MRGEMACQSCSRVGEIHFEEVTASLLSSLCQSEMMGFSIWDSNSLFNESTSFKAVSCSALLETS